MIKNEGQKALKIRQYRSQNYRELLPGQRIAWHSFHLNAPEQFCLAWDSANLKWYVMQAIRTLNQISDSPSSTRSAPINIAEVGHIHVTLPSATGTRSLLKVDTRLEGSSIFLFVAEETGRWPLRIRNETNNTFSFQQTVSIGKEHAQKSPNDIINSRRTEIRTVLHRIEYWLKFSHTAM